MKKLLLILVLSLPAFAQTTKTPAIDGTPIAGDCAKWTSDRKIGTTGTPCNAGSGPTFVIPAPSTQDTGIYQYKNTRQQIIQRISCSTDTGTVSINFDIRSEASPNSPGDPVLASPLVCSSSTSSTVTFAGAVVPANHALALLVTATNGTPTVVRIHVSTQIL